MFNTTFSIYSTGPFVVINICWYGCSCSPSPPLQAFWLPWKGFPQVAFLPPLDSRLLILVPLLESCSRSFPSGVASCCLFCLRFSIWRKSHPVCVCFVTSKMSLSDYGSIGSVFLAGKTIQSDIFFSDNRCRVSDYSHIRKIVIVILQISFNWDFLSKIFRIFLDTAWICFFFLRDDFIFPFNYHSVFPKIT